MTNETEKLYQINLNELEVAQVIHSLRLGVRKNKESGAINTANVLQIITDKIRSQFDKQV